MPKAVKAALPSAGAMIGPPPSDCPFLEQTPCQRSTALRRFARNETKAAVIPRSAATKQSCAITPLHWRQQGGGDPAVLGEQHVVGAAGRAGVHRLQRDAACLEPGRQTGGDPGHAAAQPHPATSEAAMR